MATNLIYGIDYYIDGKGLLVLTKEYLLKKRICCGNGCKHCPYTPKHKKGSKKNKQT